MRRSPRLSPLTVQFWLWGLDARDGTLALRGFQKSPTQHGSSRYRLGALELHSSGLTLDTPQGQLTLLRRPGLFWLSAGGQSQLLHASEGLALCAPEVLAHEAWLSQLRGPQARAAQLGSYRLPATIRRALPLWEGYLSAHGGLGAQLWQPAQAGAQAGAQTGAQP